MDKVPNKLEALSFQIGLEKVVAPVRYHQDFILILEKSWECWDAMKRCLHGIFYSHEIIEDLDLIEFQRDGGSVQAFKRRFHGMVPGQ